MGPGCASNLCMSAGDCPFSSWPIEGSIWQISFLCLSFPLTQLGPNLFLSLATSCRIEEHYDTTTLKVLQNAPVFLHSICGQSSQNIVLLWAAGKNNAYCTQATPLLLWMLLSDPLVFSTGQGHPKHFSASPHHFPPSPYTQPFIPIPASSCWLCPCNCVPGSGLNTIAEMIKTEGNSTSEGYLYSWWLQQCSQQHSTIIQVSGSAWQSGSDWIGTSQVALPCRRLSFVELLLPDSGMSKELQCNKSGGSRGLAQWGLEEVVGRVRRMLR